MSALPVRALVVSLVWIAGCAAPAPLGTEGAEPFVGSNAILLDALDSEEAVARLAAAGWPLGERSERAFTTDWRAPNRRGIRLAEASYRLIGAVLPTEEGADQLVLRGEAKFTMGESTRAAPIHFEGSRQGTLSEGWEMMGRAADLLGGPRGYTRL